MSAARYTEDTLVQRTAADYLQRRLGWESVYAHHAEDFGPDSLLGRGRTGRSCWNGRCARPWRR